MNRVLRSGKPSSQCLAWVVLILVWLASGISPARAWWNEQWAARKQLSVDASVTGADISETLLDFPVLVRLHTGNFGFFLDLAENGRDIRFLDSDQQPLKFHIEQIDLINEMGFIWVKLPRLKGATTSESLWMYYSNPDAVLAEDPAGTYGVNQVAVLHFGDAFEKDATAYQNHPAESTAVPEPAGFIGSAARFRGSDKIVLNPSESLSLNAESGWSFSAWVKAEVSTEEAAILYAADDAQSIEVLIREGAVVVRVSTGEEPLESAPQALGSTDWLHLSVNYDGKQIVLFLAGEEAARMDAVLPTILAPIALGAGPEDQHFFTGLIDEVEFSNVSRSVDWIKALARSQGIDSTVLTFGGDESNESGGTTSYFAIILSNVSIDGWVIIGLLALMFFTSLFVMVSKGMVISRIKKDNQSFIHRFRALGRGECDALDLDKSRDAEQSADSALLVALFGTDEHYQNSSLYQIYHAGIQEIKQRKADALKGLSPEAMAVIRVHLDAALSREYQRLNQRMVLLTIAISGGPFLGLLGTVMGVMITFAAIAATGDVNISAIAPGVSAALMTTVAGLAVAIPCLFGYNYLATQIKELTAEMRIFVDEFIHQIAEQAKS